MSTCTRHQIWKRFRFDLSPFHQLVRSCAKPVQTLISQHEDFVADALAHEKPGKLSHYWCDMVVFSSTGHYHSAMFWISLGPCLEFICMAAWRAAGYTHPDAKSQMNVSVFLHQIAFRACVSCWCFADRQMTIYDSHQCVRILQNLCKCSC